MMLNGDPGTIPALFQAQAVRLQDRPWLWHRRDGGRFEALSWGVISERVDALARGLISLGVAAGDRVALIAENCPQWVIADLAIMQAGAVTVPAFTTYRTEDHRHLLTDSGAKAAILASASLSKTVLPAVNACPDIEFLIVMEPVKGQCSADLHLWDDVLALGRSHGQAMPHTNEADLACLIYTSGASGVPRGVMLTHRNLMSNAGAASRLLTGAFGEGAERFLSFLPLSHSYEHTAGLLVPLTRGAEIFFSSPDLLAQDLGIVRPSFVTTVPRMADILSRRLQQGAERAGWLRAFWFAEAVRLGTKRIGGHAFGLMDRVRDAMAGALVRSRVRRALGGRLKAFVSGGAALSHETELFLESLGIRVLQGYGQTEAAPIITVNPPGQTRIGSVGRALPDTELLLADDGEILVRGPQVMRGYWRSPELTARTIRNGWLHTGDIGRIDRDGYLTITDRKRDFIKTSSGTVIAPQPIEAHLAQQEPIAQVMVCGDRRPYLTALIVPEAYLAERFAHLPADVRAATIQKIVAAAVAASNGARPPVERVRRYHLIDEPFSVENGLMTPTQKIRRHEIARCYEAVIAQLYDRVG